MQNFARRQIDSFGHRARPDSIFFENDFAAASFARLSLPEWDEGDARVGERPVKRLSRAARHRTMKDRQSALHQPLANWEDEGGAIASPTADGVRPVSTSREPTSSKPATLGRGRRKVGRQCKSS